MLNPCGELGDGNKEGVEVEGEGVREEKRGVEVKLTIIFSIH